MNSSFRGKSILITGAAGRIGSSVVRALASYGATVFLADVMHAPLKLLENEINELYPQHAYSIVSDLTLSENIQVVIEQFLRINNTIDGLVHCSYPRSAQWGTPFEHITQKALNKDICDQLGSAIILSQKIILQFIRQGHGNLIHISSIQGISSPKFEHYKDTDMQSPIEYSAIKSGIISMTKWMAKYYSNRNIRVNCVSPGGILDNQPQVFLDRYRSSCTNIGMLSSDQITSVILFLLGDQSCAINGQNIVVDDGWSL